MAVTRWVTAWWLLAEAEGDGAVVGLAESAGDDGGVVGVAWLEAVGEADESEVPALGAA